MAHYLGAVGEAASGLADIAGLGSTALTGASLYALYNYYRRTGYNPQTATGRTLRRNVFEKMKYERHRSKSQSFKKYLGSLSYRGARSPFRFKKAPKKRRNRGVRRRTGRRARGVAKRSQLFNPLRPLPRQIVQKHRVSFHTDEVSTITNVDLSSRAGVRGVLTINNGNTPWDPFCVTGQQMWGHDRYQEKYESMRIMAVATRITLRPRTVDNSGVDGVFFAKLQDNNTQPNWAAHGVACETLAGGTSLGAGMQQYVMDNPRYKTRVMKAHLTSGSIRKEYSIDLLWKPRYTHLSYTQDDFDQVVDDINMSPPNVLAHLVWGFIADNNAAVPAAFDIYFHKTYYVKYGNPKPQDVS